MFPFTIKKKQPFSGPLFPDKSNNTEFPGWFRFTTINNSIWSEYTVRHILY